MTGPDEIRQRLEDVCERIDKAETRAHRRHGSVRLILATKTQSAQAVAAAYAAGAREFGENYVQEALNKRPALSGLKDARWHLIGHLQTNKVRSAAANFDLIQTLDSERLVASLRRTRPSPFPVLIEINIGGEASKSGVAPDVAEDLIARTRDLVEIQGLMTIPPGSAAPEHARPYFVHLRELRERLSARTGLALNELSMGMTEDFEIAIEEGATMVRIGRAVFGERPEKVRT
jgi:pyridoxal phosphate enzyme (YggS family)